MGSAAPLGSSPPLSSGTVPTGDVGCLFLLLLASTMTFLVAWFSG
jgi:hypothetical protein